MKCETCGDRTYWTHKNVLLWILRLAFNLKMWILNKCLKIIKRGLICRHNQLHKLRIKMC